MYLLGLPCVFKIMVFIHCDIAELISAHSGMTPASSRILLDVLLIDLQAAYMQTLCAAVWMLVSLGKHFGYVNEWRHVLKTIVPHSLTLFCVSGCPETAVTHWWLSLGLYRSSVAIAQLLLESGFTSFFDTRHGNIGIKNSALKPHALTSQISSNVELALNVLSLVRHCHFALLVAP